MKWQIIVLLCCAWMNGVALGDTENSQKVEQGGTAAANTGSGNMTVYNNHYGISEEAFAKKAVNLGVTDAALANFFKILEQNKVAPADLDEKLYETAKSYKKLLESSDVPSVNTLVRQARESIEGKDAQGNSVTIDFAKAEALLQQAVLLQQQNSEELQKNTEKLQQIKEQAETALRKKAASIMQESVMRTLTRHIVELADLDEKLHETAEGSDDPEVNTLLRQTRESIAALVKKHRSVSEILSPYEELLNNQLEYKIYLADLDRKLHEMAEDSDDPEVNRLLRQTRESIEGKDAQGNSVTIDFAKAEALLQQAMLREQQHISELQQIEKQAEAALETKSESMTRIPPQLGDLVDTQFYELQQIEEQTKAARKKKQVSVVLILVQLGNLADTQLKYDKANSYYKQAYDYQQASDESETGRPVLMNWESAPVRKSHAPMNPCYQNQTPGVCDPVSGCGCTQK